MTSFPLAPKQNLENVKATTNDVQMENV